MNTTPRLMRDTIFTGGAADIRINPHPLQTIQDWVNDAGARIERLEKERDEAVSLLVECITGNMDMAFERQSLEEKVAKFITRIKIN